MAARILVADDATSIVTLVKTTLEAKGYRVDAAHDGREALRMVETRKPDLIILDVMMPKMDGLEVRKRLLADPKAKDIPVIYLSAVGDFDTQHDALAEGGYTDYMVKPFTPSDLADRVADMLDPEKRDKIKARATQKSAQLRTISDVMRRSREGT